MIIENISTLKIHKLTQEQYDRERESGRLDENALYLTPDEEKELVLDTTLTLEDVPADAKAVGDALNQKLDKNTKLSELNNDAGFITTTDLPTKTSELTNDSGFITASDIPDVDVPTKISELENDAGYLNTTTGTDGNPELRLPEMTTIASSMYLRLHGDEVSITNNGNTSSIVLDSMGGQLNGDFHVQTPTANESIANKKYVDDAIAGIDVGDTTITSIGDGSASVTAELDEVNINAMGVDISGDAVTIGSYGNSIFMTHANDDSDEDFVVTGDMHVQSPIKDNSVANKKYVDDTVGAITIPEIPIITDDYTITISGKDFIELGSSDSMSLTTSNVMNLTSNNDMYISANYIAVTGDMRVKTPTYDTSVANKKYVDDSVAGLVDSAPATLNTLKELSAALGNDENFATTVATQIGNIEDKIPTKVSELTNDSEYQTAANVNSLIKNATISTSQLTGGDSVDKLYLDGKFHIGSASSNKTFRLPADAITIEYSNDGGSTWTNYGNTAAQKEMLFDESQGYTWYLGKKTNKTQTTNDMLRVTISNVTDRYIGVKQVYHYASYNGQGLVFDLEYSTLSAPTTFVKVISDGRLRGWYGHNMYNFNQRTIGASNATTSAIRLTYKMNEINNSYASSSIKDIRFFGDNVWTAPADSYIGNMLKLNTPYKFTDDNTIDFPGAVDVNALKVNGTDISETYATKAEVEALVAKIEELMASI